MLVAAVGRRLAYPLYLAVTRHHVYVKWIEPTGYSFNIEASNPQGMTRHSDEYYANIHPFTDHETRSGCYLRALTPSEELALNLISRAWVCRAHRRYSEAAIWSIHATLRSPRDPAYMFSASLTIDQWLRDCYNRTHSETEHLAEVPQRHCFHVDLDPRQLLCAEDAAAALTLLARVYEVNRQPAVALAMYAESWRLRPRGRAQRANVKRMITNVANEPDGDFPPVAPVRHHKPSGNWQFCLGLSLGFFTPAKHDPAGAARASDIGDHLSSLGRLAEATIAYN
jgi:hypothetical protein